MTTKIINQQEIEEDESRDIHIRIHVDRIVMQQGRNAIVIHRDKYDELADILKDELILKLP